MTPSPKTTSRRRARETIGRELERQRLVHRKRRLERAVRVLRLRAAAQTVAGETAPEPLRVAIRVFAGELAEVAGRLSALDGQRT